MHTLEAYVSCTTLITTHCAHHRSPRSTHYTAPIIADRFFLLPRTIRCVCFCAYLCACSVFLQELRHEAHSLADRKAAVGQDTTLIHGQAAPIQYQTSHQQPAAGGVSGYSQARAPTLAHPGQTLLHPGQHSTMQYQTVDVSKSQA